MNWMCFSNINRGLSIFTKQNLLKINLRTEWFLTWLLVRSPFLARVCPEDVRHHLVWRPNYWHNRFLWYVYIFVQHKKMYYFFDVLYLQNTLSSSMDLTPYVLLTLELATAARTSAAFTALEHDAAQKSRFWCGIKLDLFTKFMACLGETRGWFAPEVRSCARH